MAGFPPASKAPQPNVSKPDVKPSTGNKDLKSQIAMKDKASKDAPGVEKNVNQF